MGKDFKAKKLREQKGITLLILVMIIIILLILAGITINALTGENRINCKCNKS